MARGKKASRVEQKCIYCGCTDNRACQVDGIGCHWISTDPPVCSAPACKKEFEAGGEKVGA